MATIWLISWTRIPIQTGRTRPYSRISRTTRTTVSIGMAKPMPRLPPLVLKMNVLIPITWPSALTSGPPLLPGLMAASVWIMFL